MLSLLENTRKIFEAARSIGEGESGDFALVVKPDGGLHFLMESPCSLQGAASYAGGSSVFRISRVGNELRVEGASGTESCVVENRSARVELLRDQPLYRVCCDDSASLAISAGNGGGNCGGGGSTGSMPARSIRWA